MSCVCYGVQMTSVERVVEYTELESEAPWETQKRPPPDWPRQGCITFEQMNFSYSRDGPLVLKNITATIRPNEKVSRSFSRCIFIQSTVYCIGRRLSYPFCAFARLRC